VTAGHSRLSSGKDEISINAFLIWSFPKERQTVSAFTNSLDGSSRIGWNYSPDSGADSATYQGNYRESKTEKGYGATAELNGNHSRMAITHEVVMSKIDDPATEVNESERANNVTTLQLGTSLVYAGGAFGIGRPVTDSFAIIAPRKSLSGQKLVVNPDADDNYIAKSDWLGPAVVPELSSYNATALVVGAKNLPLGATIPQDHFNLYPKYKSGYGFPLGTDANIYLVAKIVDTLGQPVSMASGLATGVDGETPQPVTVFTTRKGEMQSEGFKAGRYRLEIATDKYEPVEIVIPENAKEEYNIGTIVLKEKKDK
jgi:outer membrane usher protein